MWHAMYAARLNALKIVYKTKAGHQMLKEYAEKEYAGENVDFIDAVVNWQENASGSLSAAEEVMKQFVGATAETQVNLGAKTERKLRADLKAAAEGDAPLAPDFFDKAKGDIMKVIEKDTFARFSKDEARMEELLTREFDEVDSDNTGVISMDNYLDWARKTPEIVQWLETLTRLHSAASPVPGKRRVSAPR